MSARAVARRAPRRLGGAFNVVKLSWAFVALALLAAAAAYGVKRGVLVGSDVYLLPERSSNGLLLYEKRCYYLLLTGLHSAGAAPERTRHEASKAFCPIFQN